MQLNKGVRKLVKREYVFGTHPNLSYGIGSAEMVSRSLLNTKRWIKLGIPTTKINSKIFEKLSKKYLTNKSKCVIIKT